MSNHLIWENPENEEVLKTLARAIALSQGDFSLCLVRCNYLQQREKMVARLQELCSLPLRQLVLDKSIKTLFSTIQQELGEAQPNALMVLGLEAVDDLDGVLNSANQVREEFSKSFAFPLLLWITDEVQRKFIRIVPDIESWATTHRLGFSPEGVIQLIAENVQRVVERLVEVGAGIFVENSALDLAVNSPRRLELAAARQEVQTAGIELAPELQVGLEFILTRDIDYYGEKSRQCYERGLELLQKTANSQRSESVNAELLAGCLLYHLGLWWRRYGVEHRAEYDQACDRAQSYFQQCVDLFVNAQQPDLAARFINALGDVLQRRQKWTELAKVVETALAWHQTYPHQFRLARAYGFLAEVAISKLDWDRGWELATTAGELLESATKQVAPEEKLTVDWERSTHGSWYLLSQARSLAGKGEYQSAIAKLETAIQQSKPQYDPMLYILILEEMRSLYFQSKEFLAAFQTKQLQRSIEQQFGFRAFIGAGRVQAKQYVSNLALTPGSMASEIAASGREQDVKKLIARIERADHRLTIIHGQSGVGKSSILQAGLIPALRQITLDARQLVPVLQQVYPDWVQELGKSLMAMVEEVKPGAWLGNEGKAIAPILEQLRKNNPAYLLTVLIFDQFEEFFFIYKEPQQRRHFYEFLKQCMDIPHVKVILSLREDYLHYLLECNNRLINLGVINNNILDKGILYYLGNFSPEDAKQVIQNLTRQSQFNLEPSLLDELVRDLAGELGEVRPIELQVVGAQLQTEKIVTLKQYQEHGPKNAIVGRFLDEVVQDCGTDNEQIAKLILYLLTDENNTRPLKTRADLEMELEVSSERLDLVLEILVTSRLVFRIPAFPEDRYQLVHDYLVSFVRQQQSSQLIAELEKEREQRKLTEARLTQVLKRELQTARKATLTLGGLVLAISGFALVATVTVINTYLNSLSLASAQKNGLERLLSAIEAGKQLKKLSIGTIPEIKTIVGTSLINAINQTKEINRLEGHKGNVTNLSFSNDGHLIATLSEDKTVKIWRIDGTLITTLKSNLDNINSASFSYNSEMIVTTSKDKKVRIWNINGTLVRELIDIHSASVTSANFSHDGKLIVTASEDKTVKVWRIDGTLIKTFTEHSDIVTSANFSHDDKMIVSADTNDQIKIWTLNNKNVKTIDHYGAALVKFSPDSKKIIAINKNNSVFYYNLDGHLIKNTRNQDKSITASLSSENKILAYVSQYDDRNIYLQNFDQNFSTRQLTGHKDKISYLDFSPDGKILASASKDKTVKLWRIKVDELMNHYHHNDFTHIAWIAPKFQGQIIASFRDDSKIKLWHSNGSEIEQISLDGSVMNFSSDGSNFVTETAQSIIKLFSLERSAIKSLRGKSTFTNISFSPSSKMIATINHDNTVSLWNRNSNFIAPFILKGHADKIKSISFSNDSQRIATVDRNSAKIWRNDGQEINTLPGHSEEINSVIFSPDSQIIASIGDDNIIQLFDRNGEPIKQLNGHEYALKILIFSPNSQIIASVSQNNWNINSHSEIKLWQRDGTLINTVDDYGIENIYFSPDSRTIAYTRNNNTVKVLNTKCELLTNFKRHNDTVTDIDFSPDSQIIASASADNTIKLWHKDGQVIATLKGHKSKISRVIFSPDGDKLISVGDDNMVKLWSSDGKDIKTLQQANESLSKDSVWNKINFSENGDLINFASTYQEDNNHKYSVKIWDKNGTLLNRVEEVNPAITLNEISFSPDGKTFTIPKKDYTLKNWAINGKVLSTFTGHTNSVNSVSFSEGGKMIASASDDKTVKIWDSNSRLLYSLTHSKKVNSVIFSSDDKMIASASDDKTVKIWTNNGKLLHTLSHDDKVNSVIFSSNDKMIASASDDKTVKIWSNNGKLLHTLSHDDKVKQAEFSPDNRIIATISDSNTVKLWSTSDGKEKRLIPKSGISPTTLSFSPDSKILAIIEYETSLNLYFLDSFWYQKTTIDFDYTPISEVSFSPDGQKIALGTYKEKKNVFVLSLNIDELLIQGCSKVRDYLQNNPNVKESDRHLCDDVPKELPPAKEK